MMICWIIESSILTIEVMIAGEAVGMMSTIFSIVVCFSHCNRSCYFILVYIL
jgi:hypothetical protein